MNAEDYTIGWICALSVELTAAKNMLDEEYASNEDTYIYSYTLGRIGHHNIVIACLSVGQTEQASFAKVATHLLSSWPSIQACLSVGIGSGVPSTAQDIRLGDVVVALPHEGRGALVWYEYPWTGTTQTFLPPEIAEPSETRSFAPELLSNVAGTNVSLKRSRYMSKRKEQNYDKCQQCQRCKRLKKKLGSIPLC